MTKKNPANNLKALLLLKRFEEAHDDKVRIWSRADEDEKREVNSYYRYMKKRILAVLNEYYDEGEKRNEEKDK